MEISQLFIPFNMGNLEKLPKVALEVRKSELTVAQGLPRNVSEGQLSAIKEAGISFETLSLINIIGKYYSNSSCHKLRY